MHDIKFAISENIS